MGNSKIDFYGETLMDLTEDTVTPETLAEGATAHDATGTLIVGTATKVNIVQGKGDSTTDVMSQAAVSAELNGLSEEIEDLKVSQSQIEAPKIVSSVDEMTDTSKHYVLNGKIYQHRTIVTEGETVLVPNFTNLIKFDASGNPTNVVLNQRYSASAGAAAGYLSSQNGSFAITDTTATDGSSFTLYINKKPAGQSKVINPLSGDVGTINTGDWTTGENGEYKFNYSGFPSLKFSAQMSTSAITADSLKGLIVTINEPITYTEQKTEGETVSEWYDTGISYAPTFKTDLVGVLGENNVIYLSDNLPSGTYTLKYPDDNYAIIGTISK